MAILDITSFGASPSQADCTANIQAALDAANAGDTVLVPQASGPFKVNALTFLRPKSGTILTIDGILSGLPNDQDSSRIVLLQDVEDITVNGKGVIVGDRSVHDEKPELSQALGVAVFNSKRIKISGVTARGCAGDGFYIQDSTDVSVIGVVSDGNKRNGLSIISGENIAVINSVFSNQHGPSPLPQSGIDIEPDVASQSLINITVINNSFVKNKGAGCYIAFDPAANRHGVHVINNNFDQHYKDGSGPPTGGINTLLCDACYAALRWIPGYDYWFWPTSYEIA